MKKRLGNLFALMLGIRWAIWLFTQFPPGHWLVSALEGVLSVKFASYPMLITGWTITWRIVLGPPGTAFYLGSCILTWLVSNLPLYSFVNLSNWFQTVMVKPVGQQSIHRIYLRAVFDGGQKEELFDLSLDGRADIEQSDLSVTLETAGAALRRNDEFLRLLRPGESFHIDGVVLELISFSRKTALKSRS